MRRSVFAALLVAGCATEVVELSPMDASVDAGPAPPRDAGPEPPPRVVCPAALEAGSDTPLFNVLPDTPFRVAATSELIMTAYGSPFADTRGYGYALHQYAHAGAFGTSSIDGEHRWGPSLTNDGDRGFAVVHRIDAGVIGELLQIDAFRIGERSERVFAPWNQGPVWDVAYVDDTLVVAVADAARPRLVQVTRAGRPIGFGEAALPSGVVEARLERHDDRTWVFTRSAGAPNVVVAHRLDDDGAILASTPFDGCSSLDTWDAATSGADAFVVMACDDGVLVMSTRSTQRLRMTDAPVATAPRIAARGDLVATAYWPTAADRPSVRFDHVALTARGPALEAPLPEGDDEPAALDLAALPTTDGWVLTASSRKGDGWLVLFEGCAVESP